MPWSSWDGFWTGVGFIGLGMALLGLWLMMATGGDHDGQ